MILQALSKYYDILSSDPESDIAPPGYSAIGISFVLNISAKGELLDVFPVFEQVQRGKMIEEKPRRMIVPEQVKRAVNISANYLWDNCVYVLGISDKEAKDPEYAIKRFDAFRQWNTEMLGKVNNAASKAVIAFLNNYDPVKGREHPKIAAHLETILKGGNLVFMFNGRFVHEDAVIRQAWDLHKSSSDAVLGQCLITGEIAPIARLHPNFSVRGATPTGASLISFNERAYESYNRFKGQGLNSPVSEKATFAYATALKYLLSSTNENKKFIIGDTTVVYWAESENKGYAKAFMGLCEPEEVEVPAEEEGKSVRDKKAEKRLKKVAEKVRRVQVLDVKKLLDGLEGENPRFYVLGLAPNAARVSVRFFHSDPFEKVVEKIMQHYKDMEIIKEFDDQHTYLTVQDIVKETVSKKASDKDASPLLAGSAFRAVLENTPYPAALYNAIINRIRADQDDAKKFIKKVNYERVAIIKAYLIRKYRNQPQHPIQEVLIMSLNEQSTIPAYVLGRLFAVLEKVQQEAIGDVNASIKDRYFTSACASPKSVFPTLLRLSQHHISKAEFGYARDNRIEKILGLLDVEKNPIPSHLSLDEQGVFVLGYYHERKDLWTSKSKKSVETTESED
jgi:CRISPR-associated protein Csd1